jgi:Na+/H+ antiporter NhaD/arsenite permease-like protein
VLTPLVAQAVRALDRNPVPYLLAVAMAANIGGTATITGNPQNIMIGSFSHIPYGSFALHLAPVAALGLIVAALILTLAFPAEFLTRARLAAIELRVRRNRPLLWKSLLASGVMIALFFLGQPPAKVAIVIGALLLITRRIKPERLYAEIDWSLLLLFAGLFVVIAGVEKAVLTPGLRATIGALGLERPPVLTVIAALLSNLVSNVPAVLVLRPFIAPLAEPRTAWLTLAMAATLAGNFTVLGSVANLIVVQHARRHGVVIGFWSYFRIGAPVTLLTLAIGAWWLS